MTNRDYRATVTSNRFLCNVIHWMQGDYIDDAGLGLAKGATPPSSPLSSYISIYPPPATYAPSPACLPAYSIDLRTYTFTYPYPFMLFL